MSAAKTPGEALTRAQYKRRGWVLPKDPAPLFARNESNAQAVIAHYEASQLMTWDEAAESIWCLVWWPAGETWLRVCPVEDSAGIYFTAQPLARRNGPHWTREDSPVFRKLPPAPANKSRQKSDPLEATHER